MKLLRKFHQDLTCPKATKSVVQSVTESRNHGITNMLIIYIDYNKGLEICTSMKLFGILENRLIHMFQK